MSLKKNLLVNVLMAYIVKPCLYFFVLRHKNQKENNKKNKVGNPQAQTLTMYSK